MKKTITTIIFACVAIAAVSLVGCAGPINDPMIISGATVATVAGVKSIKNADKRQAVVMNGAKIAAGLTTITGSPTADQLTQEIYSFVPQSVQNEYPEVLAFVTPLVVSNYLNYSAKFPGNVKAGEQILHDIAYGVSSGLAQFPPSGP